MEDRGLTDSLAWRVMAGLLVAWRIVLWPAEFYGRPLRVVAVLYSVFVLLASRVLRISFSSPRVVVFVFFVFGSRFLETHHSNNGLYKLPDN